MATEALKAYAGSIKIHFISEIDDFEIADTLKEVKADSTLFVIVSQTFTTKETISNASLLKMWFTTITQDNSASKKHFVAVTRNVEEAVAFGIDRGNIFAVPEGVGGYCSLWSAVGLSLALYVGMDNFEDFLAGGNYMDNHFRTAPLEMNAPVILAMIGIWYADIFDAATHAILPYNKIMRNFPAYVRQIDTEANGKSVTSTGDKVNYFTGPVVWGDTGTHGQHSFYQLLHQGTRLIPCDILVSVKDNILDDGGTRYKELLANFVAQTKALMIGSTVGITKETLQKQGRLGDLEKEIQPQMHNSARWSGRKLKREGEGLIKHTGENVRDKRYPQLQCCVWKDLIPAPSQVPP
ncbi:glucose-6-phosphate isomerase-like [Ptychodera flava]|uniref:glucose-6-phosphate isomerase-like n=1 Tax=Ptychodera flava TaxID=63121 RepID=UPI00396A21ED